jgi:hypothetical protein
MKQGEWELVIVDERACLTYGLLNAEFSIRADFTTRCCIHQEGAVKIYSMHRYIDNKGPSSLNCISVFKLVDDTTRVSVGVNKRHGDNNWFLQVYRYSDNGVLQKIERHDPTFNLTVEYNMMYDEKGLEKITTGNGSVWWQRK